MSSALITHRASLLSSSVAVPARPAVDTCRRSSRTYAPGASRALVYVASPAESAAQPSAVDLAVDLAVENAHLQAALAARDDEIARLTAELVGRLLALPVTVTNLLL
jgi:hypothetical protein